MINCLFLLLGYNDTCILASLVGKVVCILVEDNPCRPRRDQVSVSPGATPLFPVAVAPDESGPSKSVSRLLHLHFSVPLADPQHHCLDFTSSTSLLDWRQSITLRASHSSSWFGIYRRHPFDYDTNTQSSERLVIPLNYRTVGAGTV